MYYKRIKTKFRWFPRVTNTRSVQDCWIVLLTPRLLTLVTLYVTCKLDYCNSANIYNACVCEFLHCITAIFASMESLRWLFNLFIDDRYCDIITTKIAYRTTIRSSARDLHFRPIDLEVAALVGVLSETLLWMWTFCGLLFVNYEPGTRLCVYQSPPALDVISCVQQHMVICSCQGRQRQHADLAVSQSPDLCLE